MTGRLRHAGTGAVWVEVGATTAEAAGGPNEPPPRFAKTRVRAAPGTDVDFAIDTDFDPSRVVVDPDVMILQIGRKGAAARL